MLELHNITKSYPAPKGGAIDIFKDLTMSLQKGDSVSIMGPSGSGKSTLFNIIGGLDDRFEGTVMLDGQDVYSLKSSDVLRLRNEKIGYIFQNHHLLPQLTVLENVLIPLLPYSDKKKIKDARERARDLLKKAGMEERVDHIPSRLSGGQCIRAAIVRSLINKPSLLLADEPTGFLDSQTADAIGDLLTRINSSEGTALIVFTHSKKLADKMAGKYLIENKRLTAG